MRGALMHDPVSTPDGYLFERAALEDLGCKNAAGLCCLALVSSRTGRASMARILSPERLWSGPYAVLVLLASLRASASEGHG